jgi:hypothetical protein
MKLLESARFPHERAASPRRRDSSERVPVRRLHPGPGSGIPPSRRRGDSAAAESLRGTEVPRRAPRPAGHEVRVDRRDLARHRRHRQLARAVPGGHPPRARRRCAGDDPDDAAAGIPLCCSRDHRGAVQSAVQRSGRTAAAVSPGSTDGPPAGLAAGLPSLSPRSSSSSRPASCSRVARDLRAPISSTRS